MRRHRGAGDGRVRPSGHPSHIARSRLAGAVQREISELRARVLEALLRAQALREAGLTEEAGEVFEEQRELLARFRSRVQDAVAAALVEREAELVIGSSPDAARLLEPESRPEPEPDPGPVRRVGDRVVGSMERLPTGIPAALTLVMALVLLALGGGPAPQYRGVAGLYGESLDVSTATPAPPRLPATGRLPDAGVPGFEGTPPLAGREATPSGDLDEGVRWLLDRPRSLLARIADDTPTGIVGLLDLEALTELLPAGSGRRAGDEVDETLPAPTRPPTTRTPVPAEESPEPPEVPLPGDVGEDPPGLGQVGEVEPGPSGEAAAGPAPPPDQL